MAGGRLECGGRTYHGQLPDPPPMTPLELETHACVGPQDGPHLLVTAGIHGDEPEPMAAVARLIRDWPVARTRGRVTLIPIVNWPAYALGRRCGPDGLDLARTCPGRPDGSLTEQIAHALSTEIRSADYYIDLHTGGAALELWPLAGYVLAPDAAVLARQRVMARAFGLPVVWGTTAKAEGRSLSVARDAGVPAIYVEIGGGTAFSTSAVEGFVEGCLAVAASVGMLQHPGRASGAARDECRGDEENLATAAMAAYWVEDDRDDAGVLQQCYPAAIGGLFIARVVLGQRVARGDTLGEVFEPATGRSVQVPALLAGRVLMLRRAPHVVAGDALAAILPLEEPGRVEIARCG